MRWSLSGLRVWLTVGGWSWIAWAMVALAQSGGAAKPSAEMPQTFEEALHAMSDAAAVVFAGQVVSVRRVEGTGGASGVVEVTFRVERAVRGCSDGGTYVLREWTGLWAGGDPRYRVGQRLMMLLRAPAASGISSPVGGMDGAIPIRGVESELVGVVTSAAAAGPVTMVDLRWVGTGFARSGLQSSFSPSRACSPGCRGGESSLGEVGRCCGRGGWRCFGAIGWGLGRDSRRDADDMGGGTCAAVSPGWPCCCFLAVRMGSRRGRAG
jgi:hypothetical protein